MQSHDGAISKVIHLLWALEVNLCFFFFFSALGRSNWFVSDTFFSNSWLCIMLVRGDILIHSGPSKVLAVTTADPDSLNFVQGVQNY